HHRGLVNSRRENLCGSRRDLDRFHIIFFDHNLSPFNQHLKIGILQIILLLMEARMVPFDLILEEPVAACHAWSRDPQLRKKASLVNGKNVTVGEYHLLLLEKIADFENRLGSAALEGFVPGYGQIVTNWQDTARAISEGDFDWLSTRFDAFIKKLMLENAMEQGGLDWTSPTIAMLDKLYSEMPNGLFFQLEKTGAVEQVDSPENLLRFRKSPPPDTRAAVRSKLLGLIPPDDIRRIDWDTIIFETASRRFHIELSNPLMRLEENSQLSRLQSVEQLVTLLDGMPLRTSENEPENHGRAAPDPNEKHQPQSNNAKRKKQQRGRETWNNGSSNRSRSPRPTGGKG
ncbi:MAG: proteasome accessory factor PafA2 family protein, partial [Verrucomicrobiales bacterium]